MRISVIIPAFNSASFLGETVESVLSQSRRPDEVLIVDDGSTDHTAALAESFGPPVRVLRQQNARQAVARNNGVLAATGEWIAFIDADDLWQPQKLERQMEALTASPEADLCYTARRHFSGDGKDRSFGVTINVPPPEDLGRALYRNTVFLPSSVVMRRSAFLRSGGFDPHFTPIEDWDLWLRLLHNGIRFAACAEPLMLYRVHAQSSSKQALLSLELAEEIYRKHILPRTSGAAGKRQFTRVQSEHEAEAAVVLRSIGDERHLAIMTRSIARDPFYQPHRYKILAHMLYMRTRSLFAATGRS